MWNKIKEIQKETLDLVGEKQYGNPQGAALALSLAFGNLSRISDGIANKYLSLKAQLTEDEQVAFVNSYNCECIMGDDICRVVGNIEDRQLYLVSAEKLNLSEAIRRMELMISNRNRRY